MFSPVLRQDHQNRDHGQHHQQCSGGATVSRVLRARAHTGVPVAVEVLARKFSMPFAGEFPDHEGNRQHQQNAEFALTNTSGALGDPGQVSSAPGAGATNEDDGGDQQRLAILRRTGSSD